MKGDAYTISLNEITQFANDFFLFDRKTHKYGLAQLDLAFTACNVEVKGGSDNDENPNRELCRYEFIEMLVRIAITKYQTSMKSNPPNEKVRGSKNVQTLKTLRTTTCIVMHIRDSTTFH